MADETPQSSAAAKAVSSAQLILSLVGFVKTAGLAIMIFMIDYYRRQTAKAEKQLAVAETEMDVEKKKKEIADADAKKGPANVVGDYLSGNDGGPEG